MGGGIFELKVELAQDHALFLLGCVAFLACTCWGCCNADVGVHVPTATLLEQYFTQYHASIGSGLALLLHQYCISTASVLYHYNNIPIYLYN